MRFFELEISMEVTASSQKSPPPLRPLPLYSHHSLSHFTLTTSPSPTLPPPFYPQRFVPTTLLAALRPNALAPGLHANILPPSLQIFFVTGRITLLSTFLFKIISRKISSLLTQQRANFHHLLSRFTPSTSSPPPYSQHFVLTL